MRLTLWLRAFSVLVAASFVLAACGGGGHSVPGAIVPGGNSGGSPGGGSSTVHGNGNVAFTLKIPRASASSRLRNPATISANTESLTVTVNGATPPQTFNIAAPACTMSSPNVCTFTVGAPYGLDSFLIETFGGKGGSGAALNAAATTLNVTPAGPNQANATAGTILVVTSPADSGGSCGITGPASGCTLREAVIEAAKDASNNSGDSTYTDAIMFQRVSNIMLTSGNISLRSNIVLIGPGASAPPNPAGVGAPAAADRLTIDGGGNQIFYNSGYTFAVSGLTLSNGGPNGESFGGGAIENYGSLSVSNTMFTGNTGGSSGSGGGAVYDEGPSSPPYDSVVASTFTNNTAGTGFGGAYYDEDGASFSSDVFVGNTAFFAGSGDIEGGAIYANADLGVDRSIFTNNVAGSTTATGISGFGGAISIEGDSASPTITNSTFGGSSSGGNFAGGVGPTDSGEGGAIYNDGSYPLTLSGNTFSFNKAMGGNDGYGGAISDYLGVNSTNDTFANNVADSSAGTTGSAGAGGAYSEQLSSWTNDDFTNNAAISSEYCDGGGLYTYDGSNLGSDVITVSNVQFTGNKCTATAASGSPQTFGGGLEIDNAMIGLSNVTFSGNTATATGGGGGSGEAFGGGFDYYQGFDAAPKSVARRGAQSGVKRTALDHSALRSNRLAHRSAPRSHRSPRGSKRAVVIASRTLSRARTKVVALPTDGMNGVAFTGNTANGGPGGYAYGGGADLSGDITVTATTFSSNTSTASGSGASGYGGGFSYQTGLYGCGTLNFTGTVNNNSALTQGGGLYNDCTANITGSSITANQVTAVANAADGGGGIYNFSTMTLAQSTVNANTVAGNLAGTGGGGIFNDSFLTIANSTIASNRSATDGGGLYDDYTGTIVNATFYGNQAANGNGGNIYNNNGNSETLQNSIVANGTASSGNDYYVPVPSASTQPFTDNGYNFYQTLPVNVPPSLLNPTSVQPRTPALSQTAVSIGGVSMMIFAETSASTTKGAIPYDTTNGCGGILFTGITTDQRGLSRGQGRGGVPAGQCDIGAYEYP